MDTGKKTVTAVAIVAVIALVVVGIWALVKPQTVKPVSPSLAGQAGGLLLENYDGGYARQNGGLRTGLGINASSTLEVTGLSSFYSTTTCTAFSGGKYCYEKKGALGSERIIAYGSFSSTATSGAPVLAPYPFLAGTRAITSGSCSGTSLSAGTNFLTISTTTGMATSSPALVFSKTLAASESFYAAWFPRLGTSTNYGTQLLDTEELFPFKATGTTATSTYFVRFPGQSVIAKWASSSPGTFGGGYASFTCYTEDVLI